MGVDLVVLVHVILILMLKKTMEVVFTIRDVVVHFQRMNQLKILAGEMMIMMDIMKKKFLKIYVLMKFVKILVFHKQQKDQKFMVVLIQMH